MWNYHGITGPWIVRSIGDLIRNHCPDLVFLTETKCLSSQIDTLKRKFDLYSVNVDSCQRSGGLALLWNKSIKVQLQSLYQYHIGISIKLTSDEEWWRFTGFYEEPKISKRDISWTFLSHCMLKL
ncbi:hypothetical protein Sango_0229800 [Sesamum angolense]|uniref:Endonuclease/exonuclease/phosphatase domain-containing protein n=1 Tax=Sesamum angolense TaxID=2727404 RepID=A0AAE1XHP0_9LAMI|nr:hypothetical protein Sango_0229800 [Sesamum angolense]